MSDQPQVPIYQTARVTLYHAPSETLLPELLKESVDLVIADPPYGVAFDSGRRSSAFGEIRGDRPGDRDLIRAVMGESVRLVGQERHLYVFGPRDVFEGLKVSETGELVWDKGRPGMGDLSNRWAPQHEPITFAVSKWRHAGQTGRPSMAVRMRKGSVLRFPAPTGRKVRHPNEKPVSLLRELVESSSRIGDVVLDPFAGCASTGVAAVLSGRRAVLVESDERWIPLAMERLAAAELVADAADGLA